MVLPQKLVDCGGRIIDTASLCETLFCTRCLSCLGYPACCSWLGRPWAVIGHRCDCFTLGHHLVVQRRFTQRDNRPVVHNGLQLLWCKPGLLTEFDQQLLLCFGLCRVFPLGNRRDQLFVLLLQMLLQLLLLFLLRELGHSLLFILNSLELFLFLTHHLFLPHPFDGVFLVETVPIDLGISTLELGL